MPVFYAAAFHVLAANIEDKIDIRAKMSGSLVMGNGFDFTYI